MDIEVLKSLILLKQAELPLILKERDNPLPIDLRKIITVPGVRRCGKSMKMALTANELIARGVDKRRILWMGFDDERFHNMQIEEFDLILQAYRELYPTIPLDQTYIFFDEIQLIKGWELFVLRLYKSYCKNIYISGSNASMLGSELSTELRGWPIEFETYPLSFREFCRFKGVDADGHLESDVAAIKNAFASYIELGGFPEVVQIDQPLLRLRVLHSYYETLLLKDLAEHYGITNLTALRFFVKRLMANTTKPTSINSIYNDLKSQKIEVSRERLYQWAQYVCQVFLFQPVYKFSYSLAESARSQPKYYCVDTGLRSSVLIPHTSDAGKNLENIVFNHLWANRGLNEVITYYQATYECDFVVQCDTEIRALIQVCWDMGDEATLERELRGLKAAHDATGCDKLLIITATKADTITLKWGKVEVIPAWRWLLGR